jgi:hypothetical protein
MTKPDYDYDGWAPCTHKDDDLQKAAAFINGQIPDFHDNLTDKYTPVHGGLLESMIWQLTDLTCRGEIQVDCDQWWGVWVTGRIYLDDRKYKEFKTKVQADSLLLGVAETLRWWREKYKELHPVTKELPDDDDG